ncbi:MAG: PEGA domain-containing protein [Methanomicrobiales archaeon]
MSHRNGSFVILLAVFLAILLIVLPVSAVKDTHATTIATLHTTATPTKTTVAVTPPTTVIPTANPTISVVETETTGSVMIYSSPTGASILIDGVYSGTTPKTVNGVPAGNHILRLELSSYYDYEGSIYVIPGQTAQGYGTLQPVNQVTSAVPTVFVPVVVPVVTATPVPTQDPGVLGNPSVIIALISGVTVMFAAGISIYIHLTPRKKE